jgi:cell division septation protein DedD
MDRQLAERMVGAACLLAVLVLVVPAILDGNPDSGSTITHPEVGDELDLRTHTIRLDGTERTPPVPTPVQGEPIRAPVAAAEAPPSPAGAGPAAGEQPPALPAPPAKEPVRTPEPVAPAAPAPAPEPAPATSPSSPTGGDWIVQLGSFSSRANADRLAGQIRAKGFAVSVEGGGGTSGNLYRVRAGAEADKAAAEALAGRLAAAGFKGGRVGRR